MATSKFMALAAIAALAFTIGVVGTIVVDADAATHVPSLTAHNLASFAAAVTAGGYAPATPATPTAAPVPAPATAAVANTAAEAQRFRDDASFMRDEIPLLRQDFAEVKQVLPLYGNDDGEYDDLLAAYKESILAYERWATALEQAAADGKITAAERQAVERAERASAQADAAAERALTATPLGAWADLMSAAMEGMIDGATSSASDRPTNTWDDPATGTWDDDDTWWATWALEEAAAERAYAADMRRDFYDIEQELRNRFPDSYADDFWPLMNTLQAEIDAFRGREVAAPLKEGLAGGHDHDVLPSAAERSRPH